MNMKAISRIIMMITDGSKKKKGERNPIYLLPNLHCDTV